MSITLEAMTSAEARASLAQSVIEFAEDLSTSKAWTDEEALTRAEQMLGEILPEHQATAGHDFCWIESCGARVGRIWFGPSPDNHDILYIWDLVVETDRQGQGLGGAALDAVIDLARQRGLTAVALSVFEAYHPARSLYESKGFAPVVTEDGQTVMKLSL